MITRSSLWILIILPFILILAHVIGILRGVEQGIVSVTAPLQGTLYKIGVSMREALYRTDRESVRKENEKLRQDLILAKSELSRINELEVELLELRGLLNFSRRLHKKTVTANIIGERTLGAARTILIDRGSENGIKKDYPVVSRDGILIGKIFDVKEKTSLVLIILDSRSRIAATVQNNDRTIGVIEGGHGISSSMKFIPQTETIEVGTTVITSGLEETVPRGLLIGTVESIRKDPREPFQEATIKPFADFKKLITVAVIVGEL